MGKLPAEREPVPLQPVKVGARGDPTSHCRISLARIDKDTERTIAALLGSWLLSNQLLDSKDGRFSCVVNLFLTPTRWIPTKTEEQSTDVVCVVFSEVLVKGIVQYTSHLADFRPCQAKRDTKGVGGDRGQNEKQNHRRQFYGMILPNE